MMSKKKAVKKRSRRAESVIALPERLALTPLIDTTNLLGAASAFPTADSNLPSTPPTAGATSDPNVAGAWTTIGSVAQDAQDAESGAIAENIESDNSTSTSTTKSGP